MGILVEHRTRSQTRIPASVEEVVRQGEGWPYLGMEREKQLLVDFDGIGWDEGRRVAAESISQYDGGRGL